MYFFPRSWYLSRYASTRWWRTLLFYVQVFSLVTKSVAIYMLHWIVVLQFFVDLWTDSVLQITFWIRKRQEFNFIRSVIRYSPPFSREILETEKWSEIDKNFKEDKCSEFNYRLLLSTTFSLTVSIRFLLTFIEVSFKYDIFRDVFHYHD